MFNLIKTLFKKIHKNNSEKICSNCGHNIGEFRSTNAKREYYIFGMCQKCQDKFYIN